VFGPFLYHFMCSVKKMASKLLQFLEKCSFCHHFFNKDSLVCDNEYLLNKKVYKNSLYLYKKLNL